MRHVLDHAALKTKQRAIRDGFPEIMGLRAHRSISWIGRAESCGEDNDARFIFLWIAFNAAYADCPYRGQHTNKAHVANDSRRGSGPAGPWPR